MRLKGPREAWRVYVTRSSGNVVRSSLARLEVDKCSLTGASVSGDWVVLRCGG